MRSHKRLLIVSALLGLTLLCPPALNAQPSPAPAPAPAPAASTALTKTDLDTWLDGFVPFGLESGDVAGAVVVVVKDGQVLTERGYGYSDVAAKKPVDPVNTLFRPGSASKLFTWTAVMQLVQAGKIDLDADVNTYLDFKIPPYEGKPVTMREIMTHTAGFEDAYEGLLTKSPQVKPLEAVVKAWTPKRAFAPGSTPAYSNWATMLAGYIVQRVSGEAYTDYIAHHVFQPLGMGHSTMVQPLPANLAPLMSDGYTVRSRPPIPFSMVAFAPAGSASVSGDDMGRFMIAHLDDDHNPLLNAATAREMHGTAAPNGLAPLNGMKLGFFETNIDGHEIIGHGGDLEAFHSDVWLIPSEHVGVFFSVNSRGRGATSITLRAALLQAFMDRYFPAPPAAPSDFKPKLEDAKAMTGVFISSRRSESGFRAALNLLTQTKVTMDPRGHLQIPSFEFVGADAGPRDWVEIAPFVWKDRFSSERMAAQVKDGKVVRFSVDAVSPFQVYDRVPWYKSSGWLTPALGASLVVLFMLLLSAPVGAISRRYYAAGRKLQGEEWRAYLSSLVMTVAALAVFIWWFMTLTSLGFQPLGPAIYALELSTIVAFPVLAAVAVWFLVAGLRSKRGWLSVVVRGAVVLAALCLVWVSVAFNLIHLGLNY